MSKIKIISFGGLNEKGKNMYSVDVDDNIFIFNAGLKYPDDSYLGVDYVIPEFSYIKENISKIKGIFVTHANEESYGAISDIIKDVPEIKIYATPLAIEMIKKELEFDNIEFNNYVIIEPYKQIKFDKLSVFPVSLTCAIPDAVGYVLNTEDGAIFYASDYLFDQSMMGKYKTDIGKLAYIGKKKVLCMLGSSVYAEKEGYTAPNHRITPAIKKVFTRSDNRIIFTVFESDIYRIQELFDQIELNDRKVVIMGRSLSNTITRAIDLGYIYFDKSRIGNLNNLNEEGVVILTSNERKKPYSSIERIVNGYDKFVKLKTTDIVILGESLILGYEKKSASVMDGIARIGADCINISSKKYLSPQASKEDIMLMLNLINPEYYIPVGAEYRYQFANSLVAKKSGMADENVVLAKNGDVIEIENGVLKPVTENLKVGEVLIDGNTSDDVGALVLKDREILSKDGVVIVSATIDKQSKKLLVDLEILTRGFIYVKNNTDIIEKSKEISKEIIEQNTQTNRIDYSKVKNGIRDKLGKYLYRETKCNPMILTVISDI
jgi:ribonuclease J